MNIDNLFVFMVICVTVTLCLIGAGLCIGSLFYQGHTVLGLVAMFLAIGLLVIANYNKGV